MAELSTLARPYAKAAFEVAAEKGELGNWSAQLGTAAAVANDARMATLLGSPSYTSEQMADAMIEVCGDAITEDGRNFIRVLAANKRLPLLPTIRQLFEQFRAAKEKTVDVEVRTAYPLSDEVQRNLAEVLGRKLERDVNVDTTVDESLLGGVLIRADDLVIDGSVRGRLNKLAEAMNS